MIKKILIGVVALCVATMPLSAENRPVPEFSTAGFFSLADTGREVYSMNPAWRTCKGHHEGAHTNDFDDSSWRVVSLPDGIEYLPTEASGGVNYQGEVWYRKHFTLPDSLRGKRLLLHFEAVMGKCRVYLNGQLLTRHYGGYLPVTADLTDSVKWGEENLLAVWCDNSDDGTYPPGKPQGMLDFAYFGGIYRDCWLVAHNNVYITDAQLSGQVAGGGLFVSFDKVSEASAEVKLQTEVKNSLSASFSGEVEYCLFRPDGERVAVSKNRFRLVAGGKTTVRTSIKVDRPLLWSPSSPSLYRLEVRIRDRRGRVVDGLRQRIGIRSIEFKGADGFWLNGKPYDKPVIGVNRHQDYAVVGNAVANSAHWRDACKLKQLGLEAIRNAHCPQDPAFMDACDELGLLVIVNTPGWQFWNDAPEFADRVYDDIRHLVRRDRNHACVWLWEPILNETWYPADFARRVREIVDEEYPYPYCYSASDSEARGHEHFPVQFAHPQTPSVDSTKSCFTREWGDNVDDWSSHNSPSRVARNWGEQPMRVQAEHYASPDYQVTSYDALYRQPRRHVGGCLWHSFDHQRGYHPDPFYGGLMDVFRQPKYSYYMFMAQRPVEVSASKYGSGPMVYIAHEMTPFSGRDVTVYSNCEEVRLTYTRGGKTFVYRKPATDKGMPSPIITFRDVYDFMKDKALSRENRHDEVYLLAEGLEDGKIVATHKVMPARRPEKIVLWADNEGLPLRADGSDFVTVVAAVADRNGTIKRLNNYQIRFSVEGEGVILGGEEIQANPAPVKWGTAPVLVRSTLRSGKIRITASVRFEGEQMPISGELVLHSVEASVPMVYDAREAQRFGDDEMTRLRTTPTDDALRRKVEQLQSALNALRLKEVERQQSEFGETTN